MTNRSSPGAILALLIVVAVAGAALGSVFLPRFFPQYFSSGVFAPPEQSPPPVPGAPSTPATPPSTPPGPPAAQPAPAPLPSAPAPPAAEESTIIRVVERIRPSVVNIDTVAQVQTFFGVFPQQGAGSGVIVSQDGLILTNNHVVEGAQQIKVTLLSGKTLPGRIVGRDPFSDLAVIRVETNEQLPAATLGRSSTLRVGQMAVAVGNPFGLGHTVTVGVISALNRSIQVPNLVIENLIQTDAAINPGNSGGALADSSGALVGINTAIVQQAQGIGFAIPIDTARVIMDQLISRGRVVRPYAGLVWGGDVDENMARQYNLAVDHGIIVREVDANGPAARAGIRQGDVIVALDGRRINNWNDFIRELFTKKPGDRVRVEIARDGDRRTVEMTLAERTP
ncbi:MAG TPA: trypsin-like peptidase domain-containing protein [bacterium]|nr:trypsin-like peptidase domain-containing protein [bacterium]